MNNIFQLQILGPETSIELFVSVKWDISHLRFEIREKQVEYSSSSEKNIYHTTDYKSDNLKNKEKKNEEPSLSSTNEENIYLRLQIRQLARKMTE